MSFRLTATGVYRCDTCSQMLLGHLEELPEGWEAYEVLGAPGGVPERLAHRCPACREKVAEATGLAAT